MFDALRSMRALGWITGEAGHLPVLSSVGFQFDRKALAYNHIHIILGLSKRGAMQNIDVRKGRYCVFMMHVHLVFMTKYRRARFSADQLGLRGIAFCRYADDCNLYMKSQKAVERAFENTTRFIEETLKLRVNRSKSGVFRLSKTKFLGYTFVGTTGAPEHTRRA